MFVQAPCSQFLLSLGIELLFSLYELRKADFLLAVFCPFHDAIPKWSRFSFPGYLLVKMYIRILLGSESEFRSQHFVVFVSEIKLRESNMNTRSNPLDQPIFLTVFYNIHIRAYTYIACFLFCIGTMKPKVCDKVSRLPFQKLNFNFLLLYLLNFLFFRKLCSCLPLRHLMNFICMYVLGLLSSIVMLFRNVDLSVGFTMNFILFAYLLEY